MTTEYITKCSPAYDGTKFVYSIAELDAEIVVCSKCGKKMRYRACRERKSKDATGDDSLSMAVPRFSCTCGRIRTMHPYFLARRKKYSLVALQEIVSADAYADRKGIVAEIGSANVGNSRRWVVKYLWGLYLENPAIKWPKMLELMYEPPKSREEQRTFIRSFFDEYGDDWLLFIVRTCADADEVNLAPLYSLVSG